LEGDFPVLGNAAVELHPGLGDSGGFHATSVALDRRPAQMQML
jgi:hypothetical protein